MMPFSTRHSLRSLPLTLVGWLAVSGVARGDAPTGTPGAAKDDADEAERLFALGQQRKAEGNGAEACKLYDQALSHNHNAVGTILNVALCDEEAGKLASAFRLFTEARDRAREQGLQEHRKAAEDHLAQIGDQVPHLAIAFTEKPPADSRLVIDDQMIAIETAQDILLDPGSRTIVLTAPGRVPFETKIEIKPHDHHALAIGRLGFPVTVKQARRTVGKVLTFGGIGLAATGLAIGLVARSRYNKQFTEMHCNRVDGAAPQCDAQGQSETSSARTLGSVGTGVGIGGGVAFAVGAVLWWFAPGEPAEHGVAFVPTLGGDQAGFAALGRF